MRLPLHQVDAFATGPFTGNPAAVCPLEAPLPEGLMQAIAEENNLSETAFLVPRAGAAGASEGSSEWDLRWFTPAAEVDLCGHATLASGHVVLETLRPGTARARFHTRSGPLEVERANPGSGPESGWLAMDLPTSDVSPVELDPRLAEAVGQRALEQHASCYMLLVFETERQLRALAPDMRALAAAAPAGLVCTAPADAEGVDFVSRFFAPAKGVDEDPVTGSAHTALVPYWSRRLGRERLEARQLSARGGALRCEHRGARTLLLGQVRPYLIGTIEVPDPDQNPDR